MAKAKKKEQPKDGARLEIRIWTEPGGALPFDLSEAFECHVEHVSSMISQGYSSGEIVDERFSGWWDIKRDEEG